MPQESRTSPPWKIAKGLTLSATFLYPAPNSLEGRLAQLVRARASHARGHWFKSSNAHHFKTPENKAKTPIYAGFFHSSPSPSLCPVLPPYGAFTPKMCPYRCPYFPASTCLRELPTARGMWFWGVSQPTTAGESLLTLIAYWPWATNRSCQTTEGKAPHFPHMRPTRSQRGQPMNLRKHPFLLFGFSDRFVDSKIHRLTPS
jgi:hypothetical protein